MAIRSIKGNVDRAKAKAKKAYDMGYLEGMKQGDPDIILSSSAKQMDKRNKTLAKKEQKLNKPTSSEERSPNQLAKGGMAKKPKKFKRREIDSDAGEIQHRGVGVGTNAGGNLLSDEELDAVIKANARGAFSHVRKNLDKDPDYYNKKKSGKRKMDGGKIYASMDKKYGGGIYPRKPTNG